MSETFGTSMFLKGILHNIGILLNFTMTPKGLSIERFLISRRAAQKRAVRHSRVDRFNSKLV